MLNSNPGLRLEGLSETLISTKFPASIVRLENGLTVIHQAVSDTSVAVVDVWVKAGAIAEPEPWNGMAHFLEHMIFKGTDRLAAGVFDQAVESHGGLTNAATSHDYAHFFVTTPVQHLGIMLPYLAELILNAAIPDHEFFRERDVVLEEIRQANDDPDWLAFQALMESVYHYHPYGRPILGTEAQLRERSPAEMRCFHQTYYQPENMTVVVVGGISQEHTLKVVSQAFSSFPTRSECPSTEVIAEPPITEIRRQELCLPRLEQARLLMAWVGPGVEQLQDAYGLDLLSIALADGRSSRLVRELREERQLVQAISSNFSLQRESSLFTISAWLEPQQVERVEALIGDRLSALASTPMTDVELNRCKRLLCNDYAFSTETSGQLAGLYGYYHTIAQAEVATVYPEQIRTFQPEDLQGIANQYLCPQHYAVTVLKPI